MGRRIQRHRTGRLGETLVAWQLRLTGHRIVTRNWRTPAGEVDILAEKAGRLLLVEVRSRRHTERTPLAYRVDSTKLERLERIVRWLRAHARLDRRPGHRTDGLGDASRAARPPVRLRIAFVTFRGPERGIRWWDPSPSD